MRNLNIAAILCLTAFMLGAITSSAQKDEILVTVGDEAITTSEFLQVYKKNNVNANVIDKKSLEEYLDLYINFKLKVKEAEDQGLDTVEKFTKELEGYRKQLAKPYLTDESVKNRLLREAYERQKFDVRASHILIKVNENAPPEDTMAAYNRISGIRELIMNGEDFGDIAMRMSEDPSAKDQPVTNRRPFRKGNKGDLGYFTVFDMLYPFESAAYNTPVGEVSQPVRTIYGYHLIKVTDKKPAMGNVQVAHILLQVPPGASKEDSLKIRDKAREAYEMAKNNSFEEAVKQYSDDKGTIEKGGLLPWFGVNRMIPEFILAVMDLKEIGDISEPFVSYYGWHIIKLLDKKESGSYEESLPKIKDRFDRSDRSRLSTTSFLKKLKNEYNFKSYDENLNDLYEFVTDTIFLARWHPELEDIQKYTKPLFEIKGKKYLQKDFLSHLEKTQTMQSPEELVFYINRKYNEYADQTLVNTEDEKLEDKYPEFKMLVKEYRDGILLFELTDQKIWSKAIEDSAGLANFHEKNKNNYMWGKRADATVYTLSNPEREKEVRKMIEKSIPSSEILEAVNQDADIILKAINDKYEKGENEYVDQIPWEKGLSKSINTENGIVFIMIHDILPAQPKQLNEARGIITADYQSYLEGKWIEELRAKYKVVINEDVLSKIK